VPDADPSSAADAVELAGLPRLDRRQLAGSVSVADRVVLTGSDPKRLSDRDQRRLAGAVPHADADPHPGTVAIAVPDRRKRSGAAVSSDAHAEA
jgi:hypothetical protein